MTVSTLKGEHGYQRKEIDKLVHWLGLDHEAPPDVVNLPNALLISLAAPIRRTLGRPVVVTLQGEDLFVEGLTEPFRSEALALMKQHVADVDLFVSVSEYYTRFMADYLDIPASKLRTVPLGINVQDFAERAPLRRDPFTIGYFARIAPEKGLHNLAEAYRILRHDRGLPPAKLVAAGYLGTDHQAYLDSIERQLRASGLAGEFHYAGTLDRGAKVAFLRTLDLLSVPSGYHDPKGLYLLEAMASGVPVVQPNHGAFPEVLRHTCGGILSASEKPEDVADAIMTLWQDPARAAEHGARGAEGVRSRYTIGHMADAMLSVYSELCH
jgi:glycosyltransferase involved in cell wall biosynthesis